jgi:glycosyltransferase involved in cell wall biosynthesis
MRIGVDARELQGRATGVGRYLRGLLRAWPANADDDLLLYFNGPIPADAAPKDGRIALRPLGERAVRGLWWQEARLPRAASRDGLDVFFAPAYACPLLLDVPRVTTVHDLSFVSIPEDFAPLDGARRRALVGLSLGASRRVVAVSEFTRREILAWRPDTAGRVEVICHGSEDDLPPAAPRVEARARLGVRGPLVVSVGSILTRRHMPTLLKAMAILLRSHPDAVLDVVGENRTHPPIDIEAVVGRLDIAGSVRLSGFQSDAALALRYAAADVAVYLSEYEGFGMPVLEAMARGIAVVTSLRPATGELFGGAALTVDPADPGAIAAAIGRLLDDLGMRGRLVERGRTLAARYTWAEAAARTREVLAEAAR